MDSNMSTSSTAPASVLYRRVWRWHFYAGLLCLPFIFSLAVTGALYLFHQQIDELVYGSVLLRAPAATQGPVLRPTQLIRGALAAVPGQPKALFWPADARHTAQIDVITASGEVRQVFVDPVSGVVRGVLAEAGRLMTTIKHIHSLAIAGDGGKALIEIVAGWIIVLLLSGAYLWWPRGRSAGVVSIRSGARGRTWWRDLHAVSGAFAGLIVLFLALTGMPWSVFWGANVNTWLTEHNLGVPKGMWRGIPKSTLPAAALGDLPWAQQQDAVPASVDPHAEHQAGAHHHAPAAYRLLDNPVVRDPDDITTRISSLGLAGNYRLALPRDGRGVYSAICMSGRRADQRVIHLDQYSGKVLMDIGPEQTGAVGRITEWGVSVHQGGEYGTPNLLAMLAGCLTLITLCISGVAMWWLRRPAGRLAAPARKADDRLARGVLLIAVVLGCVFPLLGASMLVLLLGDALTGALRRGAAPHNNI